MTASGGGAGLCGVGGGDGGHCAGAITPPVTIIGGDRGGDEDDDWRATLTAVLTADEPRFFTFESTACMSFLKLATDESSLFS